MEELYVHLQGKISMLNGKWISKNSGYEKEACVDLGFNCEKKRYWDSKYKGLYIEIKKGKSIWLDEVRYSEIYLSDKIDNEECKIETITMFLIPSKNKEGIKNIYLVDTRKIIEFLNITTEWAERLLTRKKETARCLNCLQSMTVKDLKSIADYII